MVWPFRKSSEKSKTQSESVPIGEIVYNAIAKARSELTRDQQSKVAEFLKTFNASKVFLSPQFVYPEMLAHGMSAEVVYRGGNYTLLCDARLAEDKKTLREYVLPYSACLVALDVIGRHCAANTLVIGESYPIPGIRREFITRIVNSVVPEVGR